MNRLGEWIGWAMHYLLGLVLGGALGAYLVYGRGGRRYRLEGPSGLISDQFAIPFILGAGLVGAGLGALFGDRLWMGEHYRIIAPESPAHTPATKIASVLSIVAGAVSIAYALFRQFSA